MENREAKERHDDIQEGFENLLVALKDKFDQEDWQELAACREEDPDIFFVEQGQSTALAKTICELCIVRKECRDYSISRPDLNGGIWDGRTYRERQSIRKTQPEQEERKAS